MFTTAIPVAPNSLPAEILEKLEEYDGMDEYSFAVDENTIFCCIDGDCYYVIATDEAEALAAAKDFAETVAHIDVGNATE